MELLKREWRRKPRMPRMHFLEDLDRSDGQRDAEVDAVALVVRSRIRDAIDGAEWYELCEVVSGGATCAERTKC
jgi:hypothetical protein